MQRAAKDARLELIFGDQPHPPAPASTRTHQRNPRPPAAVKQTNVAQLEKQLLAVSDPRSPEYGQHLTNDEVRRKS